MKASKRRLNGVFYSLNALKRDPASLNKPSTLPLDEAVLVRWKQLLAELKGRNRTMTCEDSLIAATALHHDHTILTGNTAHFAPAHVSVLDPMK